MSRRFKRRNLPKAVRTREPAEAREAEQQLPHSSAQFAILVQSIKNHAIYMMDKTGRITSWNKPRVELMSKLPHVNGNRGQLQEVMFNLIVNAIEAMETTSDQSRLLHVRTELRDRQAVAVVVKDSGPGIDKDKLDGIFTAFVSTKRYGTGLGLAICRMIIEYHGGKLSASSDSKDDWG
jgi:signal transduction histidine kinase